MDLANWALRISPKFTTGVKYQFNQGFCQMRDPEIPITLRPTNNSSAEGRSSTRNSGTKAAVLLDIYGAGASRCFPHPTFSLASEQTLKDLKRSQEHQRGGEESEFG